MRSNKNREKDNSLTNEEWREGYWILPTFGNKINIFVFDQFYQFRKEVQVTAGVGERVLVFSWNVVHRSCGKKKRGNT